MFKYQDLYYARVFLKFWFFRQLEKRNIPKDKYKNYFLAEYRAEFPDNSSEMLPVEKEFYNINALETLDISIPKKNTK